MGTQFKGQWLVAVLFSLLCCALAACNTEQNGSSASSSSATSYKAEALAAPSTAASRVVSAVPGSESGIDFTNKLEDPRAMLDSISTQAGAAAGDYDADGDTDFFISGLESPSRLYRNDGGMKFSDVTAESGPGLDCAGLSACGAVFADLDSDKDLDLYVGVRNGENRLFMNDGSGRFTEEGKTRGAASGRSTVMAAVLDVENDGDLDMYLCNYAEGRIPDAVPEEARMEFTMGYQPETGKFVLPPDLAKKYYVDGSGKMRTLPDPDELLINDGKGKFHDNAQAAGLLQENGGWDLQALPADYNNDGFADLLVCNDFEIGDRLYLNQGDGTFRDEAEERLRVTSFFSMGADTADLNSDGWLDILAVDMSPGGYKDGKKQSGDMRTYRWDLTHLVPQQQMRNAAYLNRGDAWFSECAEMLGVKSTEWSWTARISDLNCDGRLDMYVSNGFINRVAEKDVSTELNKMSKEKRSVEEQAAYLRKLGPLATDDVIFEGTGQLSFSKAPDNWGMKDAAISCGVLLEDFDGDGDQDFLSNNTDSPTVLWRNDVAEGQRLVLRLRSDSANTQGVGARVTAWVGDAQYCNEVILSRGWATGCSSDLYIGLGTVDKVDKLTIRWPDLSEQTIENLAAGFRYTITQPRKLPKWQPEAKPAALFAQRDFDWEQKERETGDTTQAPGMPPEFTAEQLLPAQRSQLGTGCAVTDLDGDGSLDVYFGGAAGQSGALFKGDGQGGFSAQSLPAGLIPDTVEQMGVLAFDPNADGRPDLLVASGGNESAPGTPDFLPRLIANPDGSIASLATFAPEGFKGWSAGSAAAADLDGDGDLEILLCGRQWPFAYMKPAYTRIYEAGEGGKSYSDATAKYNAEIERIGVVADGQFMDLNGDGAQDLVLAMEMGPVAAFFNQDGKLVRGADIADNGMWQSLGAGDFDNDGDLDLLAGNIGWNTKYHPKDGKPMTLVCDDFDKNGVRDLIEVKWRDDGCAL
ncbi:VCBS repeat-containing protein, partial [bacterium]|nr:VCBS repeat-containing protein [bacterium]